ncbi:hypothetical protein WNY78_08520 [Psychroserpens sp. AS72]|uniref:hypothetical protein n=1 Tax=Psychroserpens sp. AS72 TaxID=3135775 RepID=UPI00317771F5
MKKLIFTLFFLGCFSISFSQDLPKVGDVLKINEPYAQTFNYVFFPKTNILKKRGKISGYKSVYGDTVVITEVNTNKNGDTYVVLKKKDNSKFFGYLTDVKANYAKSIDAGELSLAK